MRNLQPKILYLEIDEEVTSVIDRINETKALSIMLVIPNRASLLQSIVNLKLLKKIADNDNREIAIVTTDKTGRSLASHVGLTVYSNIEKKEGVQSPSPAAPLEIHMKDELLENTKHSDHEEPENSAIDMTNTEEDPFAMETEELHIQTSDDPKVSSVSVLEKSRKLRERLGIVKKIKKTEDGREKGHHFETDNFVRTSEDYKEIATNLQDMARGEIRFRKEPSDSPYVTSMKLLSPNKKLLYLIFGMSIFILLIVGYFVLPNATIIIEPKVEPISHTANVSFLDIGRYSSVLKDGAKLKAVGSYPIEIKELALTEEAPVSGKKYIGARSAGTITIKNNTAREWKFIPNTRFQSPEGFIYRSVTAVIVPRNGQVSVAVVADEKDASGNAIGAKGNIPATKFILPGLGASSPSLVEGFSTQAFTGGSDQFVSVISQGDIDAAKQIIIEKLYKIAEQKIQERIEKENKDKKLSLRLFKTGNNDNDIKFEVLELIVDTGLLGQERKTFPIAAKVKLYATAYNLTEVQEIMKQGLVSMVLDNRTLIDAKTDAIEFKVIENLPKEGKIRVETTLTGVTEFKVDDRLSERIKREILGKSSTEALEVIDTMPEVGGVKIDTWPFWVRSIPGVKSNIRVIQQKDEPNT